MNPVFGIRRKAAYIGTPRRGRYAAANSKTGPKPHVR